MFPQMPRSTLLLRHVPLSEAVRRRLQPAPDHSLRLNIPFSSAWSVVGRIFPITLAKPGEESAAFRKGSRTVRFCAEPTEQPSPNRKRSGLRGASVLGSMRAEVERRNTAQQWHSGRWEDHGNLHSSQVLKDLTLGVTSRSQYIPKKVGCDCQKGVLKSSNFSVFTLSRLSHSSPVRYRKNHPNDK